MRSDDLFIYHGNCFDGFTAAWLYWLVAPTSELVPAKYGDAPPDVTGRNVWIADFSYPRAQLLEVARSCQTLRIFDHHKTAQADLDTFPGQLAAHELANKLRAFVFDMGRSGARLIFDELQQWPEILVNHRIDWAEEFVNYIQDRDLWRQKLEGTEEVAAWVAASPMTFGAWTEMAKCSASLLAKSGACVKRYIAQYGRKARAEMRLEEIAGYLVPAVNLPYMNCSEHVGKLEEDNPDSPFAVGYFRRADGRWQFSLRARSGFDVSEVAKRYGGGGHAGAAGFDVARLPWECDFVPTEAEET
mgnify:CR=1 FL=1